ncbi:hypothetical protein GCM10023168_12750 [Fodinibacter luteus]|uniref:X-X-X-Leu-X-X-Gly heptad repeat protein n=1 Tax=Fodinibacter luteus TaxID=552064 RepID=A0ABP8K8V9_9MICO
MSTTHRVAGFGVTLLAASAAMVLGVSPAAAATIVADDVVVTNTETVQAYLDPTGQLDVARIYDQIAMQGNGTVDLRNPVETEGLRNLDSFGGFEVVDGEIVGTYEVDGDLRLRAVSDFPQELPLEVAVTYALDGEQVEPEDVVGETGTLEVQYTVRNVTGQPQDITYDDGTGTMVTATEDVVIPMVGSLTTVLPPAFTDVTSNEANMAGDGRGGTKMSFTMTLFGPIGAPEATFGYRANISDGVIPPASISALPVSPLDSPSFKGGSAAYQSGAVTGATLTAGATTIDDNLLKLRDGAGELLAGLIKLKDGAGQLNAGLTGTAAPGAAKLADGTDQAAAGAAELSSGLGQLDDGANQLADGAGQVADGAGTAATGADTLAGGSAQVADGLDQAGAQAPALIAGLDQVAAGLAQVDAGLETLSETLTDPDTTQGVGLLQAGIKKLIAGIGTTGDATTLLGGVEKIRAGLAAATATGGSIDQLKGGVDGAAAGAETIAAGLEKALLGVNGVRDGNTAALAPGGSIEQVGNAIRDIADVPSCAADPLCVGTVNGTATNIESQLRTSATTSEQVLTAVSTGLSNTDPDNPGAIQGLLKIAAGLSGQVSPGIAALKASLIEAATGLARIECGLSNASLPGVCDPDTPGLLEGLQLVDEGVATLVGGVVAAVGDDNDTSADKTLRGGIHSLQAGVDELSAGGQALILGLDKLSVGATLVAEGNADLATGLDTLADGAGQVSSGADQLADGTGTASAGSAKLADGTQLLAVGANQLADGLLTAADGSSQLAVGLGTAAEAAPALPEGAQRLSDEGTSKLIDAGKATAADYGVKYALIEAGAERAQTEAMIYGAPADATGKAAYSIEIAGVDSTSGNNLQRGLVAAALFGLAAGGAFLLRRQTA